MTEALSLLVQPVGAALNGSFVAGASAVSFVISGANVVAVEFLSNPISIPLPEPPPPGAPPPSAPTAIRTSEPAAPTAVALVPTPIADPPDLDVGDTAHQSLRTRAAVW